MRSFIQLALCLLVFLGSIASAQFGTGNLVFGTPRLMVSGDTSPGGTTQLTCYSPLDAGRTLVYAYSSGYSPTPLADGRLVNLTAIDPLTGLMDPLFQASTDPSYGAYAVFGPFIPQYAILDSFGLNTQTLNIPSIPGLAGVNFYALAAIFDPTTSSITGIGRITPTATITVRNPTTPVHYVAILDPPGVATVTTSLLNDILNGPGNTNIRGIVRVAPIGGPVQGQGGVLEHVEFYEGHGFNNGPNNINENGGGDDIDLGPVPGNFAVTIPGTSAANFGTINSTTGVFVAGPQTTEATGNATIRFVYGVLSSTRTHRTVPPDWVKPAAPAPTGLTALFGSGGTTLSWANPTPYDLITVRRGGVVVGLLGGTSTVFVDASATGPATYSLTCDLGAYISATAGVTSTAVPFAVVLTDDDSISIPLNFTFTWYGQYYTSIFVTSNGRVTFGTAGTNGDADYSGTPDSFVSGAASFGAWTDLDPSLGGTITVDNQATSIKIIYAGIPHKTWPGATASFTIELSATNTAKLTGLPFSIFPVTDNIIIGGGPGNNVSTTPSMDFSSILPLTFGTAINENIAEEFPSGNLVDVTGLLLVPVPATISTRFRVFEI